MCSLPMAAGGQSRVGVRLKERRKRPQYEEQDEEDGHPALHLASIVHENLLAD